MLIHPADTEQGFAICTAGQRRRHVVDFDGLQLIKFAAMETEIHASETSNAIVK
ncbi:hypothetical protein GCM10027612_86530 [Microbispora bryophytorum subsp. camponoti]